jgi:WD40 repeat protein
VRWQRGEPLRGHSGLIFAAAFNPSSQDLLTGDSNGLLILWDLVTMRRAGYTRTTTPPSEDSLVHQVAWSTDGALVAVAERRVVTVREAGDLAVRCRIHIGAPSQVRIGFLNQDQMLAVGTTAVSVFNLKLGPGQPAPEATIGPVRDAYELDDLATDPRGDVVVVADSGGSDDPLALVLCRSSLPR